MTTATELHYTTYIRSTAEKVWQAITTPEFAKQYWGNVNVSDWKAGSVWKHQTPDGETRVVGTVREAIPPRRLVLSWAAPDEAGDPGRHSLVTFAIEALDGMVRLDVTHGDLIAGSQMAQAVSGGWPRVLSSLKSFLETGIPLGLGCH